MDMVVSGNGVGSLCQKMETPGLPLISSLDVKRDEVNK